jgi:hypothetical protein
VPSVWGTNGARMPVLVVCKELQGNVMPGRQLERVTGIEPA